MPKSKRLSAYPDQYFQVFELTEAEGKFVFPAIPKSEAHSLRFDLYGFKGALHAEDHPQARAWDRYKITLVSDIRIPGMLCVTLTDVSQLMDALFERCDLPARNTTPSPPQSLDDIPDFPMPIVGDANEMDNALGSLGYTSGEDE